MTIRRLLPPPAATVDGPLAYLRDERPPHRDRPWLTLNMVASLDGATAIKGRSGQLGGPSDRAIFFALRAIADVVLVGAGTARAEHYGPPALPAELQTERTANGQSSLPTIGIVTNSLDLDLTAPIFSDAGLRPVVVTSTSARADRVDEVARQANVIQAGSARVDLGLALAEFRRGGVERITCEGGPTLNGALLECDLVDELCLTIAPVMVGGDSKRVAVGGELADPRRFSLDRVLTDGSDLFLRYLRNRA